MVLSIGKKLFFTSILSAMLFVLFIAGNAEYFTYKCTDHLMIAVRTDNLAKAKEEVEIAYTYITTMDMNESMLNNGKIIKFYQKIANAREILKQAPIDDLNNHKEVVQLELRKVLLLDDIDAHNSSSKLEVEYPVEIYTEKYAYVLLWWAIGSIVTFTASIFFMMIGKVFRK